MTICFLDCEFTDLNNPELLSLGLVALDGREHYVELDLATDIGKVRVQASSDFVRWSGVLDQWKFAEGATATDWEMGAARANGSSVWPPSPELESSAASTTTRTTS